MPIIKCKMCGGDIQLAEDKTFGTCEYCGSVMTLPRVSDEQRAAAFNRGNHFRRTGEFDKALGVYEHIVADDDTDAEAHWCCALCRFGIEYVEDPATYEWLPTCHRASFDSFLEDVDYLAALEHSDGITRRQYQKDAAKIAEVQRGILAASQNTEPYDVFISYKELDGNGERTRDSILAQEIYYRLTEKGWRVFFSRISLEDVPGTQYEPYIFAALNSAKVMVVIGTSAENLNAVWVKNEWSRFLAMMRKDRSKLLIPCYRDMDPYDLPEQLSVLMSYDMSRIGFIQDLIRGVDKVLSAEKKEETVRETVKETVVVQQSGDSAARITAAMDRGFMALEDGEWNKAVSFFDQVLSLDAKNARAYYGMALAKAQCKDSEVYINMLCAGTPKTENIELPRDETHIREATEKFAVPGYLSAEEIRSLYNYIPSYHSTLRSQKQLNEQAKKRFESDRNLIRARQFASGEFKTELEDLRKKLFERLDQAVRDAEESSEKAKQQAEKTYRSFITNKDKLAEEKCRAAEAKRESAYQDAIRQFEYANSVADYMNAKPLFAGLAPYKDSEKMVKRCDEEATRIEREADEEAKRQRIAEEEKAERQRIANEQSERERAARKKRNKTIAVVICVIIITVFFTYIKVIAPANKYKTAEALFATNEYELALSIYQSLGNYKNSEEKYLEAEAIIKEQHYIDAKALLESGKYGDALNAFKALTGYKDVNELLSSNKNLVSAARQEWLSTFKVIGNTVILGQYEQDNNSSNGKENIEWIVLATEGNKSLLISKYALDCKPYNTKSGKTTWENCTLRGWLNQSFFNASFSSDERTMIPYVTISAEKKAGSTSNPNDTSDRVFLLSISEAEKYFKSNEDRICEPTAYAIAQGVLAYKGNKVYTDTCEWWLRSLGSSAGKAICVDTDGSIDSVFNQSTVGYDHIAIRPAVWITLA